MNNQSAVILRINKEEVKDHIPMIVDETRIVCEDEAVAHHIVQDFCRKWWHWAREAAELDRRGPFPDPYRMPLPEHPPQGPDVVPLFFDAVRNMGYKIDEGAMVTEENFNMVDVLP